jgi:Flp pilus assembly protein TadG
VRRRRERADDRGVSAIEFAFIAPTLLLLIWFVLQAGLYFYGRSVALQAAREAVSQYRLAQSAAQFNAEREQVRTTTTDYAANVGSSALDDVSITPRYDQDTVTVTVKGSPITLVPFLNLTVTETASGTVEKFETPP